MAYLMHEEGLSLAEAEQICKLARPKVRPNESFMTDLQKLEAMLRTENLYKKSGLQ